MKPFVSSDDEEAQNSFRIIILNDSTYEGYLKKGMKEGLGKITYNSSGNIYEGTF